MDPAIVSSQRPNAVYTRAQLLALHASPLIPTKPEGMKELADWHGDFAEPPSPTQQRHGLPSRPAERSERATPRRLHNDAPNPSPFAHFGRFGVDGGVGEPLESGSSRRRARGGLIDREADKDAAPHLRGSAGTRSGDPSSPTKERRGFELVGEREKSDKIRNRVMGGDGALRGDREFRRREDVELGVGQSRRDVRRGLGPADEGGWRNVGMSREEREKRLTRNQASPGASTTDSARRDRGERGERDRSDRDGPGGRTGRPSWMDDDSHAGSGSNGGSSPAWMDAPATGSLSFDGTGHVRDGEDRGSDQKEKHVKSPLSTSSPSAGKDGMDSLQAFKAQMKERERKDREREMRAAGLPVDTERTKTTDEVSAIEVATTKSIFEDLGIARAMQPPPGLEGSSSSQPSPVAEGGRASRFARFFDGKPAGQASPQQAAQQPPTSAFSALLAGSALTSPSAGTERDPTGPSKEDAESMARLLGMLQVSSTRSASPLVHRDSPTATPQPVASPSPLPSQAPSAVSSPALATASSKTANEGRASSRFNFTSRSAVASPAMAAATGPPGLQSPFIAAPTPSSGGSGPSPQQQPAAAPAHARSPTQPPARGQSPPAHVNGEASHVSPPYSPQGPPMPPAGMPPAGMPPHFFGQRFPPPLPGQLPPGMPPPHFGFAPDGRPLPPPPHPGMLPPFASPPLIRANGPLSPPLASPNGQSPGGPGGRPPFFPPAASLPPQMMFAPGGPMPPPPPGGGMPFPPPPLPHNMQGRMPPPQPIFTAGGNPGADLMALLNSGASGQRIGGDAPPQGVHMRPM